MDEGVVASFGTVYGAAYRAARERGEAVPAAQREAGEAVRDFGALMNKMFEEEGKA